MPNVYVRPALVSALAVFWSLAAIGAWPPWRVHESARRIEIIEADRPIAASRGPLAAVEPHVVVDPLDANHLVVAAIVVGPASDDPWHCAAFASFDRGRRWTRTDFRMERCIDPWVTLLPGGRVIFTGIEIRRADTAGGTVSPFRLVQFRSTDGGRRWTTTPDTLGRAHDRALVVSDPSRPAQLLLASRRMRRTSQATERHTLFVAHLDTAPGALPQVWEELRPSNLAQNVTGVVPLPAGTVVVTSWDFQRDVNGYGRDGILARGRAWAFRARAPNGRFSEPLFITDECASGIEGAFPGYPALAQDTTRSTRRGWLYHACVRPGLDGVAIVVSSDAGETWTDPVRLAGPATRVGTGHARTPMLAVGRDGAVGVAWYDRSHDESRRCQHVLFTASTDGARTFAPAVRVNSAPTCPDTPENGRVARSWPMGGDYGSLTTAPDGSFRLVWADSRDGRFHLRTAAIGVTAD